MFNTPPLIKSPHAKKYKLTCTPYYIKDSNIRQVKNSKPYDFLTIFPKRVFGITLTSMSFHYFYPQYPQNYPHVYIAYCYFNSFQNAMSFTI